MAQGGKSLYAEAVLGKGELKIAVGWKSRLEAELQLRREKPAQ